MSLLDIYSATVLPDWLDYNGHMNEGYYGLAFGFAIDTMFIDWQLPEYMQETGCTFYSAETHITYLQELAVDSPLRFTAQIVGMDAKKIQIFYQMIHAQEQFVAATAETMHLHFDQKVGKVVPMLPDMYDRIFAIAQTQASLPVPAQAGRSVKQLTRLQP